MRLPSILFQRTLSLVVGEWIIQARLAPATASVSMLALVPAVSTNCCNAHAVLSGRQCHYNTSVAHRHEDCSGSFSTGALSPTVEVIRKRPARNSQRRMGNGVDAILPKRTPETDRA